MRLVPRECREEWEHGANAAVKLRLTPRASVPLAELRLEETPRSVNLKRLNESICMDWVVLQLSQDDQPKQEDLQSFKASQPFNEALALSKGGARGDLLFHDGDKYLLCDAKLVKECTGWRVRHPPPAPKFHHLLATSLRNDRVPELVLRPEAPVFHLVMLSGQRAAKTLQPLALCSFGHNRRPSYSAGVTKPLSYFRELDFKLDDDFVAPRSLDEEELQQLPDWYSIAEERRQRFQLHLHSSKECQKRSCRLLSRTEPGIFGICTTGPTPDMQIGSFFTAWHEARSSQQQLTAEATPVEEERAVEEEKVSLSRASTAEGCELQRRTSSCSSEFRPSAVPAPQMEEPLREEHTPDADLESPSEAHSDAEPFPWPLLILGGCVLAGCAGVVGAAAGALHVAQAACGSAVLAAYAVPVPSPQRAESCPRNAADFL